MLLSVLAMPHPTLVDSLLGLLHPLNIFGTDHAIQLAFQQVKQAYDATRSAADPVFVAVPHGMNQEAAYQAGHRWVWHIENGAKAAAHVHRALDKLSKWVPGGSKVVNAAMDAAMLRDFVCTKTQSEYETRIKNFI
jgi:hypothetical protein